MSNNIIKVGMAEYKTAERPYILTTIGLGSCVGIALYDIKSGISGLAHIMLPDSTQIMNNSNAAKFADTAIECLIKDMIEMGAQRIYIQAKIAGGACMFSFAQNSKSLLNIGTKNIESTIYNLKLHGIPIQSMDVGADYGRTIELDSSTGILRVKTIDHGIKEI